MPDQRFRVSSNPIIDVLMVDNEDGTYSISTSGGVAGGGGDASAANQDEQTVLLQDLVDSTAETIAWGPRAGDSYVAGLYNELAANTEEAIVIPTTPATPKSVLIFFEESTSSETLKAGRVAFADSATDPGVVDGTDTVLGYHPPIPLEYPIPSWATHVFVASPVAGRVAKGQWIYE